MKRKYPSLALAALLLAVGSLHAQKAAPAVSNDAKFAEGQIIVKFRENHSQKADSVLQALDGKTKKKLARNKNLRLVKLAAGKTVRQALAEFQRRPEVEYAEPDYIVTISQAAPVIPNDARFGELWGMHNIGQVPPGKTAGLVDLDIDAPEAWASRTGAPNVVVAVIDTGIRLTHQDLRNNLWVNVDEIPANGIDDDANGYVDDVHGANMINPAVSINDDNGHGSHVAGTIGAEGNNGVGVAGVAWDVQIMAIKTFNGQGSGTTSDIIEAFDYARANGAQIINCSFGGDGYSQATFDALTACRDAGIIASCAVGNSNTNVDFGEFYPSGYLLDNIVGVGAMNNRGNKASFSSYGIGMTHVMAPGESILSCIRNSDTAYGYYNGTSMAAPHVAGVLAMLKAQFPGDTHIQLINRLLNSATRRGTFLNHCMTSGIANVASGLVETRTNPINDTFLTPVNLQKLNGVVTRVSTVGAGLDNNEATPAGPGGASVWYRWTASRTGPAIVTTERSNFDTLLGVYTGGSVGSLVTVAQNDDADAGTTTSHVEFQAVANTQYRICIAGKGGAEGFAVLQIAQPPANDNFADRTVIDPAAVLVEGENFGASVEVGEPQLPSLGGASVWYSWTPSVSGRYQINSLGSEYDTMLGLYSGASISSLNRIVFNDDVELGVQRTSQLDFDAVAGSTYALLVDGFESVMGRFDVNFQKIDPIGEGFYLNRIGLNTQAGSLAYDAGAYTMQFSGSGLDKAPPHGKEGYSFLSKTASGDFTLTARVASFTAFNSASRVGLMARNQLLGNEICGVVYLQADGTATFGVRFATDRNLSIKGTLAAGAAPRWLQLRRTARDLSAFASADGVTWQQVGTTHRFNTGVLADALYVGVIGSTGDKNTRPVHLSTAVIDNLLLQD